MPHHFDGADISTPATEWFLAAICFQISEELKSVSRSSYDRRKCMLLVLVRLRVKVKIENDHEGTHRIYQHPPYLVNSMRGRCAEI